MTSNNPIRKIFRILWRGYLYLCVTVFTAGLVFCAYVSIAILSVPRHHVELPNGARLTPTSRIGDKVALMTPNGTIVVSPDVVAVQWNAHYVAGLRYFPRPNDPKMRSQAIRFVYKVGDMSAIENQPENHDAFKKLAEQSGLKLSSGLTAYTDLANDPQYIRYDGKE